MCVAGRKEVFAGRAAQPQSAARPHHREVRDARLARARSPSLQHEGGTLSGVGKEALVSGPQLDQERPVLLCLLPRTSLATRCSVIPRMHTDTFGFARTLRGQGFGRSDGGRTLQTTRSSPSRKKMSGIVRGRPDRRPVAVSNRTGNFQ